MHEWSEYNALDLSISITKTILEYFTRVTRKMENTNQKKFPYLLPIIKFEPLVGPLNRFRSSKKIFLFTSLNKIRDSCGTPK